MITVSNFALISESSTSYQNMPIPLVASIDAPMDEKQIAINPLTIAGLLALLPYQNAIAPLGVVISGNDSEFYQQAISPLSVVLSAIVS
jgi:hypothetical protein